ncbi:hypothetical protein ZZ1p0217 [Acinetobacter phage ZZ1]|uniref:Uncharacterized protein n=1 Tax=Acinetobacter phage ZZ1 TaxID=1049283 RepID=I3WW38_9CAUD|nr:hypothetical protein ZZ1p0217 [Acinetobacter phage ZZ1]AFL47708.1 hypothetical protein ZZ1p0217 [Acinetobacter phage ZZ1]
MKYKHLFEDARDAGYPHELYTPRELGPKDYQFVATNANRAIGSNALKFDGTVLEGSVILQNNARIFQYSHKEGAENEYHIESVEMYRDLWNSIHIPLSSAKFLNQGK